VAEDTTGLTSDPTQVLNDTPEQPDETTTTEPGRRRSVARWIVFGGIGLGVIVLAAGLTVCYGVFRLDRTAAARSEAATRLDDACTQLEQRLNRLVPPGATRTIGERSDAIRDENAAAALLVAELDRMPARARGYQSLRGDWRSLLNGRERYAVDLDASRKTGRPAFFVMTRDKNGNDRVERIIHRSPDRCDGPVRRLAAPDL
jgi:hypothetical protein